MVNDLMDASSLESSRLRIIPDRLDLGELIHDVAIRVPASPWTEVRVPENDHLVVKGDAQRLEQVVTNLLSNALKYGAPGNPESSWKPDTWEGTRRWW